MSYDIIYIWNLKKWYKWTYLQKRNRPTNLEKNLWLPKEKCGGRNKLGIWSNIYTLIYKIYNQQGPTVSIGNYTEYFVITYMGKGLPLWLSGKKSASSAGDAIRYGFHPWVGKNPWRRKWQLTPVFLVGNPIDRGVWQATAHRVTMRQTWLTSEIQHSTCGKES